MQFLFGFMLLNISALLANQVPEKDLLNNLLITVATDDAWIEKLNLCGILNNERRDLPVPCEERPLFQTYPELQKSIPHLCLGSLPTPVEKLTNLGAHLKIPALYIKRDDLSGAISMDNLSHLYGGNKVRKLEFLLGDALAHDAKTIFTFGCAGSNHAVATSVYANQLGLKCVCMLQSQPNSRVVRQNLLLHQAYNSRLCFCTTRELRKIQTLCAWLDHKYTYGDFPYIIPTGGSNPLGALGFVNAAFELRDQINQGVLPEPDFIYIACGSMATTVGLMIGCKLAGLRTHIIPVVIQPVILQDYTSALKKLYAETSNLLHTADPSIPELLLNNEDLVLALDQCGSGYAVFSEEGVAATRILKQLENIKLEGTYTGKALAALISDAEKLKDKTVLFWNTFCGLDFSAQTSNTSYKQLPVYFQYYFEKDVQELDSELMLMNNR